MISQQGHPSTPGPPTSIDHQINGRWPTPYTSEPAPPAWHVCAKSNRSSSLPEQRQFLPLQRLPRTFRRSVSNWPPTRFPTGHYLRNCSRTLRVRHTTTCNALRSIQSHRSFTSHSMDLPPHLHPGRRHICTPTTEPLLKRIREELARPNDLTPKLVSLASRVQP